MFPLIYQIKILADSMVHLRWQIDCPCFLPWHALKFWPLDHWAALSGTISRLAATTQICILVSSRRKKTWIRLNSACLQFHMVDLNAMLLFSILANQVWLACSQATWFALVWSASGLACIIVWLNQSSRIFPLLKMLCLCSQARLACLCTGVGCLLAWAQLLLCHCCLCGGLTGFHASVMVIIIWVLTHNWVYFVAFSDTDVSCVWSPGGQN